MEQSIISKIKEKGIKGLLKSIRMRFIYTFITPWFTMHSSVARLIWRLLQCLPIKKNLVIFSSEPDFCDNSWALYQYLRANRPQCRFVWMVINPEEFSDKVDERTTFVSFVGPGMHYKAIYYFATARWNFYTHYTFNPYIPRKGQIVIHLCHGTVLKGNKGKSNNYFDWLLTTGKFSIESQSIFVGCDPQKVLPLGSPRNDILNKNKAEGTSNPFCPSNILVKKVILWMPTFRSSVNPTISENIIDTETGLPLLETLNDIEEMNSELSLLGVVVLVKIHHLQANKNFFKKDYSNFIILTDEQITAKGLQLYQIVGKSDALLSDYSSIMVDYLIVDKPIGFILDDYEKYAKSRGFSFDNLKDDILKGYHIYTKIDFLDFIKDIVNGNDVYRNERHDLKKKFHDMEDGENCKSIVDYFGI